MKSQQIEMVVSPLHGVCARTCVDVQRAAGQGDAKAHSKTPRGVPSAPPRRRRGPLGLWVLLRFRLALAGRALQVHTLFPEPRERKK